MKPNTKIERRNQWGWFAGLWFLGLAAMAILGLIVRWIMHHL